MSQRSDELLAAPGNPFEVYSKTYFKGVKGPVE